MAEVKLLLKTASEQSKKKLIESGTLDEEQVQDYLNALKKYDSVDLSDYHQYQK
jgi:hypothetical protein